MTNPSENALKACPFCGDACWANKDQYKTGTGYLYSVHCPTCHYSFNGHDFNSEESAIKAWNTRHESQPALVPTDNDCAGFVIKFEQRMLQKTNQGLRGEERGYLHAMIKNFCVKFGQVPQRDEVTVEEIAKVAYEQYMKNANIEGKWEINLTEIGQDHWRLVAQAIHDRIKGGKHDNKKS